MPTTATDTELVRQYLAGDQRALGDIYERYGDRVYDLCFAMLRSGDDAADAYQDTFLTAANKLDQLRDTERLRSWLYSVARNQCRARLRARKRSTPVDDAGVDIGTEVDMTADLGRDELRTLLTEASAGLNEREREVLDLHMRHELEGEELADALGVSVQNAYKLVQRVRDRVERSLNAVLGSGGGAVAMLVGLIVTIAVQSSSITTSIMVPLAAAGVVTLRNIFPVTLGANVGTTITALLAALASGSVDALTIALVHTTYNVTGIVILYPMPRIRAIPLRAAERMADLAVERHTMAVAYVITLFIVIPLIGVAVFR